MRIYLRVFIAGNIGIVWKDSRFGTRSVNVHAAQTWGIPLVSNPDLWSIIPSAPILTSVPLRFLPSAIEHHNQLISRLNSTFQLNYQHTNASKKNTSRANMNSPPPIQVTTRTIQRVETTGSNPQEISQARKTSSDRASSGHGGGSLIFKLNLSQREKLFSASCNVLVGSNIVCVLSWKVPHYSPFSK